MEEKIENIDSIIAYWIDSSDQNYKTMNLLLTTGEYSWSLFLGHLVIEKLMKALYVKRHQKHALFSHDLLRLAQKIGLELTDEQSEWLDEISTFNLNARYDNYKQDFYRLCTKEFSTSKIERIEILRVWLINQL